MMATEQNDSRSAEDYPVYLRIPSINVSAAVQQTGLSRKGNMGVPTNYTDVAWYKYGPIPGEKGSAVIDGHVDNGLSLPGVFKNLDRIKVGDTIIVKTAAGTERTFTVQETKMYPYKEVPTELLFNRTDRQRLNLITCTGAWLPGDKTYDQRLVVFAVQGGS
jgi:sortase A